MTGFHQGNFKAIALTRPTLTDSTSATESVVADSSEETQHIPEVNLKTDFGNRPKIANDDTDLPEPDSPTIPTISFLLIW